VGRDPRVDIAALELDSDAGLPPLHSGAGLERLRVGGRVHALGAPSVAAAASLSRRGRQVALARTGGVRALQLDAAIARSDSGGPLIDDRGQVVGVTTAIARPSGRCSPTAGFAIPVDVARSAALALVEND
jgi:S1-C subfamily serine protease